MTTEPEILTYMQSVINDHIDAITGEINVTALAEDAFDNFIGTAEDIPQEYFEAAFEVVWEHITKATES